MDAPGPSPSLDSSKNRPFPRGKLGSLDASVAAVVAAVGGDVVMVIDRDGFIRDMALGADDLVRDGAATWLDQRWSDTVTLESRHKIDELLREASSAGRSRWREVSQIAPGLNPMIMRFVAVDAGRNGQVIAIGRDDRSTWAMQQRLVEAQQAVERDYARLRDAESRYKLLFQVSDEAVVVVDASTKKILEVNPAADALIGDGQSKLVGQIFSKSFDRETQDDAASLINVVQSATHTNCSQARLTVKGRDVRAYSSLFRQDRSTHCLVRLRPDNDGDQTAQQSGLRLQAMLERFPDAFVITDEAFFILSANGAFLDLARVASHEQAIGQSLDRFLGRAGLERNMILDSLREHGAVRSSATVLRNLYGDQEDVEVSAVSGPVGSETCFGFMIRSVRRRQRERSAGAPEMRRSVEQLTELVGRVKLKELVGETTDLVEKLCIEAALELTKGNRASAAALLGLSRQSLYSKLHRFGIGNVAASDS